MESMTGYGRASALSRGLKVTTEIRSVNNRYLDIKLKLPPELYPIEGDLRSLIREHVSRGSVQMSVAVEGGGPGCRNTLNLAAARRLHQDLARLKKELGVTGDVTLDIISRFSGMIQAAPQAADPRIAPLAEKSAVGALSALKKSRSAEGRETKAAVARHLAGLRAIVSNVRRLAKPALNGYRDAVRKRISDILRAASGDDRRADEEASMAASRRDFSEEVDRLSAHLAAFGDTLRQKGPKGRNLEFLVQEMHRELTTIASKAPGQEIIQLTVDARVELEKIREQVYNIE